MGASLSLRLLAALLCLLGSAASAGAQPAFIPSQAENTKNQEVTSAGDAAVSVTLTAGAHTRARVYAMQARCSAGTAGITVTDGGTTIWSTAAATVGTGIFTQSFSPSLTGSLGQAVVVTLSVCAGAGGKIGTLDVQADIF